MPCKNFSALVSHSATPPLFPFEFNFDIRHLSGAENVVADALSRPDTAHSPSVPKSPHPSDVLMSNVSEVFDVGDVKSDGILSSVSFSNSISTYPTNFSGNFIF
jgi:hypothetical protein